MFLLAATVAALFASRGSNDSQSQTKYAVGQVAREDVFAPKKISVIDPVATEERRQIELENALVIFRLNPNAANEVVSAFNADFANSRKTFLDAVEKSFNKRKLSTNQVAGPRFREVYTNFKKKNKTFPATVGQALKWAHGNEQEPLQAQFRDALRRAAGRYIRSDEFPVEARGGLVRIIRSDFTGPADEIMTRSQAIRRTNLVDLGKAQKDLALSFRENDRVVSDVLTNYLKANCVFDKDLTAQFHADKTKDIWTMATYQQGQAVVRRGQIIDAKMKAALDEIGNLSPTANGFSRKQVALWATAVCCAALALWIGLRSFFSRRGTALIPAENVLALPTNEREKLQAQLAPHLARGLMNKLVRGLISQRADLIETQHAGAEQLNQLEQRLEQINTRLETRQVVYEQRIAELEKELAAAEEENRELIRAKIHEARQNLEWARAQNS